VSDTQARVAVVTGAGSGIGRGRGARPGQGRWSVVLAGRRPDALKQTARLSFSLIRLQPLCVQWKRDSHQMSCGAARCANPAKPYCSCSVAHSNETASDTTNPAASMGSSEWKYS
jgi:NAD(P)-dependent dehydrogenase (short-subunit alcohol dehydrogenase family)